MLIWPIKYIQIALSKACVSVCVCVSLVTLSIDCTRGTYAATYNFDSSFVLFISSHFTPVGVHYEEGNRNQQEMVWTTANNNTGCNEYETEIAEGNSGFRSHFADSTKGNEPEYDRRGFYLR